MLKQAESSRFVLLFALMRSLILLLLLAGLVRASDTECVVAFGATWCGPCQEMKPVEESLVKEGYDIRCVDIDEQKELAKNYRVTAVPCFVSVRKDERGWHEVGRITGKCTAGQLRRLCVIPRAAEVGAKARSAVRNVIPLPEW